jgi:hypothetical protein
LAVGYAGLAAVGYAAGVGARTAFDAGKQVGKEIASDDQSGPDEPATPED